MAHTTAADIVLYAVTYQEDMSIDIFELLEFSRCSVVKKRTPKDRQAIEDTHGRTHHDDWSILRHVCEPSSLTDDGVEAYPFRIVRQLMFWATISSP